MGTSLNNHMNTQASRGALEMKAHNTICHMQLHVFFSAFVEICWSNMNQKKKKKRFKRDLADDQPERGANVKKEG